MMIIKYTNSYYRWNSPAFFYMMDGVSIYLILQKSLYIFKLKAVMAFSQSDFGESKNADVNFILVWTKE